jgi:hypothetical protein
MAKADTRTRAGECCRMAVLAPSAADRATWLKLAFDWVATTETTKDARTQRMDVVGRAGATSRPRDPPCADVRPNGRRTSTRG